MTPSEVKKEAKRLAIIRGENTFETVTREWHEKRKHGWVPSYAASVITRLERHILKKIGHRPIARLALPELLSTFRIVEKTGALDMAQRVMQYCSQIFMYAIATGRVERNPVADLRGALKSPVRNQGIRASFSGQGKIVPLFTPHIHVTAYNASYKRSVIWTSYLCC